MNLCDSMHDEVCYEGRSCPVCETEVAKDTMIADRDKEIDELRAEVDSLTDELNDKEVE